MSEAPHEPFDANNAPNNSEEEARGVEQDENPGSSEFDRKLFIGGLSWDTTDDGFRNYFKQFGTVQDSMIMRDRVTGTSRGFGFITFKDVASTQRVLNEKNMELDGRRIDAKLAVPRGQEPPRRGGAPGPPSKISREPPMRTTKIFVGGVPLEVNNEEFRDYFSKFGEVLEAQIMLDHHTNRSRGFGFVTFDNEDTVEKVCRIQNHTIQGKTIDCKPATPKRLMDARAGGYRSSYYDYPPPPHYYDRYAPRGYDRYDRYGPPPPRYDRYYDDYDYYAYRDYRPPPPPGPRGVRSGSAGPPPPPNSGAVGATAGPPYSAQYSAPAPASYPQHSPQGYSQYAQPPYQQQQQQQSAYPGYDANQYSGYDPAAYASAQGQYPTQAAVAPAVAPAVTGVPDTTYGAYGARTTTRPERSYHPYQR